jgi:CHAT domain-containing protein
MSRVKTTFFKLAVFLLQIIFVTKSMSQEVSIKDSLEFDKLNKSFVHYYQNASYDTALIYAKQLTKKVKTIWGENHPAYAVILNAEADIYEKLGNFKEAIQLTEKAVTIFEKEPNENIDLYSSQLSYLGQLYSSVGRLQEAKLIFQKCVELDKNVRGLKSLHYGKSLGELARTLSSLNEYTSSENYYKQALEIDKLFLKEKPFNYITTALNLANLYIEIDLYKSADSLLSEVLVIINKDNQIKSLTYPHYLQISASLNIHTSKYDEALKIYKEILTFQESRVGKMHKDYAYALNNLASVNHTLGNLFLADTLYKKSLLIYQTLFGEKHPAYSAVLNDLALLNSEIGYEYEAEKYYTKALLITKQINGVYHTSYATTLSNMGNFYLTMNNYSKAKNCFEQAIEIAKKISGENSSYYALVLENLAVLYKKTGEYAISEKIFIETLSIHKRIFGITSKNYVNTLNNLAGLYSKQGDYIKANELYLESIKVTKEIFGESHTKYSGFLSNLALNYSYLRNYKMADSLYNLAISIIINRYGKFDNSYERLIGLKTDLYYESKNHKLSEILNEAVELERRNQNNFLSRFSESEKEIYLIENKFYFQIYLSMLYYNSFKNTNSFYQSTTSKQSWLLQGKQQLIQLANQSKDTSVKSLLIQWQNTNRLYAQAIQLTTEKRKLNNINVDSLQEQSVQLEKQLIAAMPALQALIINNGFTGKEVAAKLKPKEAVVHWVSFQYKSPKQWTDSVLYAAYIITANDTAPKFVTVFEEKQLQQILKSYHGGSGRSTIKKESNNNTNTDIALYNLIWKPLLPYLQNTTTVYNLPASLLHKISFAALTDSSNKPLIDTYELHQLLSINELVNPLKITNNHNTIALFGGANYDAVNTATTASSTIAQAPMYRNASDNKTIRFNYLQGTKTEVETVASNAKNTNWKTQSFIGIKATEDNFKTIGGENAPKILHIATHGFYFPPTKTKPNNFINDDKNAPRDFPLLRSGLVLSGVNNYWGKDTVLENKEDGIVTAQEISNLNLLNTDLVVLSACQTALGDINGSEGVYGLQRAFKMAGVKKLLMSLWEVPDAETAELMQLFYSNVFKGDTYYTAFRKAQLALKAKYKDTTKWAGFVLVGE